MLYIEYRAWLKKKRGKKLGQGTSHSVKTSFGLGGAKTCFVGWFVPHPPPKLKNFFIIFFYYKSIYLPAFKALINAGHYKFI